jgi:hypothetical protein
MDPEEIEELKKAFKKLTKRNSLLEKEKEELKKQLECVEAEKLELEQYKNKGPTDYELLQFAISEVYKRELKRDKETYKMQGQQR